MCVCVCVNGFVSQFLFNVVIMKEALILHGIFSLILILPFGHCRVWEWSDSPPYLDLSMGTRMVTSYGMHVFLLLSHPLRHGACVTPGLAVFVSGGSTWDTKCESELAFHGHFLGRGIDTGGGPCMRFCVLQGHRTWRNSLEFNRRKFQRVPHSFKNGLYIYLTVPSPGDPSP